MNFLELLRLFGFRHFQLKPARFTLTIFGIALGISLLFSISLIERSTQRVLKENIDVVTGGAALTITGGVAGIPDKKLEIVRAIPGVRFAIQMIEARAYFENAKESVEGLSVLGVDLLQESTVRSYQGVSDEKTGKSFIDDPLIFLNQPDSIIITQQTAKAQNLKIDDTVSLSTAVGVKKFTIRGLLEPEGIAKAYGGSIAIMDIDGAAVMFGKTGRVDRIDVIPESGSNVEELKIRIQQKIGKSFSVLSPDDQADQTEKILQSYHSILRFFSSLALLVGLFLIASSISISIEERRKEIGILRAIGSTKKDSMLLFLLESLGMGFLGSILGCFLGWFLAEQLLTTVTESISAQSQMRLQNPELVFSSTTLAVTLLIGMVTSLIAAYFPSRKISQIHPLEAMRTQDESGSSFSSSIRIFQKSFITSLATQNLSSQKKKSIFNVSVLIAGLVFVVLIGVVRGSFYGALNEWVNRIFVADLIVTSDVRAVITDLQPMSATLEQEILEIQGVRPAEADRGLASRMINFKYQGKQLVLKAYDRYPRYFQDRNFAIQSGDSHAILDQLFSGESVVMVSPSFLEKQNKEIGDLVDLDTPTGTHSFKIIASAVDYASPNGVLFISRTQYIKYWQDSLVTAFVFNVEPGFSAEEVRRRINQTLGRKWKIAALLNSEFKFQMNSAIDKTFVYTRAIEVIALIVGLIGLLNAMTISVLSRTREFGVLRAVGASRGQIQGLVFSETLIQGLIGSVIALLLGLFCGWIFVKFALVQMLGWNIQFYYSGGAALVTVSAGIFTAILAGIYPARRVARLEIVEGIR